MMSALERIQFQDISISLNDDGRLKLQPREKITLEIVADAKAHKAEIIQELILIKSKPCLPVNKKPAWCLDCEKHCYKWNVLCCRQEKKAVYYLDKCPLEYWIKDSEGLPHTIN